MQTYEVEVKSLLGSAARADEVRRALQKLDPSCKLESRNKQLNHYFEGGDLQKLADYFAPDFPEETKARFRDLATRAKTFSVRTRDKDGTIFLVVKVSADDTSSENGIARMELENKMESPSIKSIDDLDRLVLATGFKYQAKWSREREEYVCRGVNVTLDRNAGYGWLAEFERIVEDASRLEEARSDIRALMKELGVEELPQSRLERMFAHYNKHWAEYYGTEKVFMIE